MPHVKLDRLDGAALIHTAGGAQARRTATVSGLAGPPAARLQDALSAARLPRLGEAHPTLAGLVVRRLEAQPEGEDAAVVHIHYGPPAPGPEGVTVDALSSLETMDTDRRGLPITVAYSPTGLAADRVMQVASVTVPLPRLTLRFVRRERANPAANARRFVGAVNRRPIFGAPAGAWLCTRLAGESGDGGSSYLVRYDFQHHPRGWQPVAVYTDPATGRPPADLVEGLGRRRVDIYREEDFHELGLEEA